MHHDGNRASPGHYTGTERCASIWACPVCSAVIRAERAREIQQAADLHRSTGGQVVMVTLTLRHRLRDPLAVSLDAAVTGWKKMLQRRAWRKLMTRIGMTGYVRAIEVTYGANGWHPHVHALLFLDRPISEEVADTVGGEIHDLWAPIVTDLGARTPSRERGVTVRLGAAAEYVAKVQEHDRAPDRMGAEMARFDLKASRSARGLMPFELLDAGAGDRPSRALWVEYVTATRGRRAITWSRGLRERFAVEERDDAEIIEETAAQELRLVLPGEAYDGIRNSPESLALVLELVEEGCIEQAAALFGGLLPRSGAPPGGG